MHTENEIKTRKLKYIHLYIKYKFQVTIFFSNRRTHAKVNLLFHKLGNIPETFCVRIRSTVKNFTCRHAIKLYVRNQHYGLCSTRKERTKVHELQQMTRLHLVQNRLMRLTSRAIRSWRMLLITQRIYHLVQMPFQQIHDVSFHRKNNFGLSLLERVENGECS